MVKKSLVILACLALVTCAALLAPSAAKEDELPRYEPVADWPQLPKDLELGPVAGIATDTLDRVYIFHRGKRPILVFDKEGKLLRSWGDDLIKMAHGLRVDRDNNVWITDIGHHQVIKFDSQGKVLLTLGKKDQPGEGPDQFNKPTDVAVGPAGEIYVSDGYGNSRVVKFSKEGKYLKAWGKKGTGAGEFDLPHAIVLDARGRVYVGDRENNRVQIFDQDGKYLDQWKETGAPYGLFLTAAGRMFIADGRAQAVTVLNEQGKRIGRWGQKGRGAGQLEAAHWVWVDSRGAVYVADTGNKRGLKFVTR
jgi:DNA-binding beta-propeller fold protein YncE